MNLTNCKVIADSTNVIGKRLLTLELVYPRIIHAEVMSYCSFARNANSSRAMTPGSIIQQVRDEGFVPEVWRRADVKGMVPKGTLNNKQAAEAEEIWIQAMHDAIKHAKGLADLSVARELTNRILEPFSWIKTLVTASWPFLANFLHQRTARDAQQEIRNLATVIGNRIAASKTVELDAGQWHIPYGDGLDCEYQERLMVSVARCARISYATPRSIEWGEKKRFEEDLKLANRLQRDAHWSPFEHQALCWVPSEYRNDHDEAVPYKLRGKFEDGWVQYRKTISGECFTDYNLKRFSDSSLKEKSDNRTKVSWDTLSTELANLMAKSFGISLK